MVRFHLLLPLAVVVGMITGSDATQAAFKPRTPLSTVNKALSVRGGAGPIDPELAAKAFAALGSAQGVMALLAPEQSE